MGTDPNSSVDTLLLTIWDIKKRQNKQLWMWWILPLVIIGGRF